MKQGKVHIQLNKDKQIATVTIATGLDETYRNLFEGACTESRSGVSSIDTGAKVVIFGSFWLEAICNRYLRQLLEGSLPPAVSTSVWKVVERVHPPRKKFDIVAGFHSGDAREVLKGADRVFELRNRLAHFKESYQEVAGPHPLDMNFDEWLAELPETELVSLLKPPKLETTIEEIVCAKAWLDEVYECVGKRLR